MSACTTLLKRIYNIAMSIFICIAIVKMGKILPWEFSVPKTETCFVLCPDWKFPPPRNRHMKAAKSHLLC